MSSDESKTPPNPLEGDTNNDKIVCKRCSSVILLQDKAIFVTTEKFLPHMTKKSEASQPSEGEDLTGFWVVGDMFTFENVGFTHPVENLKYLTCADCEIGPIGYHDTNDKTAFYISHHRVNYET